MRISFALLILIFAFAIPAELNAGEIEACGTPEGADSVHASVGIETGNYCDIHQRRLDYREEAIRMRQEMKYRAENYAEPRKAARKQYEEDVKALHASFNE